jgi:hypothetical protein
MASAGFLSMATRLLAYILFSAVKLMFDLPRFVLVKTGIELQISLYL